MGPSSVGGSMLPGMTTPRVPDQPDVPTVAVTPDPDQTTTVEVAPTPAAGDTAGDQGDAD